MRFVEDQVNPFDQHPRRSRNLRPPHTETR
jgi:hypothetical protein